MKLYAPLLLLMMTTLVLADDVRDNPQYVTYLGDSGVIVMKFQIQIAGHSPQQLFESYVDDLMKSLDANGDSVVTVEEARGKILTPRDVVQAQLVPTTEVVSPNLIPDVSPADGKISRSELLTYFKRIGLHPFVMQFQTRAQTGANRRGRQAQTSSEPPLFARLDLDGDRKLSTEELMGALKTLRKFDLDGDETISIAELNPINIPGQNQVQMTVTAQQGLPPFLGLGSGESLSKQLRRLIEKYDVNARPKAVASAQFKSAPESAPSRNQKLNPEELGLTKEAFDRFDGDGDGQLDFDELRQFLTTPEPALTITIQGDSLEPLIAESGRLELNDRIVITSDGAVNVNLGSTQLSINRQRFDDATTIEPFLKPLWRMLDQDNNGYLERTEANEALFLGATFQSLDTDQNGKLFLDEAVPYFKMRFDAARSRTILTVTEQGRTLFEILDSDRDRRLSFRELQAAAAKLPLWDRDHDGQLSENEIPLQYQLTVSRGTLNVLGGGITMPAGMNIAGQLTEKPLGPIWFRKMDKNRDGEVSQGEFLGELTSFDELDQNADGFIDLSEAEHFANKVVGEISER
ncbi:EF-hand domain-containing protein [Schlesneria paludicola]|uniref:EF-hand domain-containing protein n=1 Tax=Schlesneria paludicola TaxID=360056 RepID=UPI00029B30A1|nr:EF-hand domain-containing protein [Schlesneria paludicola]